MKRQKSIKIQNNTLYVGKIAINLKGVISFHYSRISRSYFGNRMLIGAYGALISFIILVILGLALIIYSLFQDFDLVKSFILQFQEYLKDQTLQSIAMVGGLILLFIFLYLSIPILIIRYYRFYALYFVRYGKNPVEICRGKSEDIISYYKQIMALKSISKNHPY